MDFINTYKYPVAVILFVIIAGWVYFGFIREGHDAEVSEVDQFIVEQYTIRMNAVEAIELDTQLFESEAYQALTDEFEEDVPEADIGRVNPFAPLQ